MGIFYDKILLIKYNQTSIPGTWYIFIMNSMYQFTQKINFNFGMVLVFFVTCLPPTAANLKHVSYLVSVLSHVGVLSICISHEMLYS